MGNHMKCKRPYGCGHDFCWVCKGPWKEHNEGTGGYFRCQLEKGAAAINEEEKQQGAAKDIKRYEAHYSQYFDNMKALKVAEKIKLTLEDKVNAAAHAWKADPTRLTIVLQKAADAVIKCKRELAGTYPVAYYKIKEDNRLKDLFIDHQTELAARVDRLLGILESDFSETLVTQKARDDVNQKTRQVLEVCGKMIEGARELRDMTEEHEEQKRLDKEKQRKRDQEAEAARKAARELQYIEHPELRERDLLEAEQAAQRRRGAAIQQQTEDLRAQLTPEEQHAQTLLTAIARSHQDQLAAVMMRSHQEQ